MDTVRTGNGRVQIKFVDNSTVNVTEQSKLVIDDFVYSGKPSTSRMALKFASGTVRFATGSGIQKSNINLRTPTATIAVRGTDFTTTVDELGRSLIILLPEADGSVGEITVSNDAGEVILNRAFQATMVETVSTMPTAPVILNLNLNMIDNQLIINPPKEIQYNEIQDSRANILDLNELDMDFLEFNKLDENYLDISSLDVSALDANFLEDYLDDIGENSDEKDGITIEGTTFGYNETTQIFTVLDVDSINISRLVNQSAFINIPKDEGKFIILTQDNIILDLKVNGGGTNIIIKQGN